jgi:hypothetical protein
VLVPEWCHGHWYSTVQYWNRGTPGYAQAHIRVSGLRGKASSHPCVDCQEQAAQWSLRHDARRTRWGKANGYPARYSLDIRDYDPRCLTCHGAYDSGP